MRGGVSGLCGGDRDPNDVNGVPAALDPEDYSASQELGRWLQASGSDGIVPAIG